MSGRKRLREMFRSGEAYTYPELSAETKLTTKMLRSYCSQLKSVGAIKRVDTDPARYVMDKPEALEGYVKQLKPNPVDNLPVEIAAIQSRPILATVWTQA